MATQSPFSFLNGLAERVVGAVQPPPWLVHEVQHRLVLFLNHVLMQEREAMERLRGQQGRVAHVQWRQFALALQVTPAGLLDLADHEAAADLRVQVTEESPLQLAKSALGGDKPTIRIEGDVQLAAEINWLADNLRWDAEEDLARIIGDAPAHTLASLAQRVAAAMRRFAGGRSTEHGTLG